MRSHSPVALSYGHSQEYSQPAVEYSQPPAPQQYNEQPASAPQQYTQQSVAANQQYTQQPAAATQQAYTQQHVAATPQAYTQQHVAGTQQYSQPQPMQQEQKQYTRPSANYYSSATRAAPAPETQHYVTKQQPIYHEPTRTKQRFRKVTRKSTSGEVIFVKRVSITELSCIAWQQCRLGPAARVVVAAMAFDMNTIV